MHRSVIVAVCIGGIAGNGACVPDPQPVSDLQIAVDTLDGVERIVSAGAPPVWRSDLVARIGASEGDGPNVFGQIRSVALDGDFNVYVADGQASQIRVFDTSGVYTRTIGREGAGPGEFRTPFSLGWIGDTLAVQDFRNARIGLVSRTGAWLGSWRWQPLSGPDVHLLNGSIHALYAPVLHGVGRESRIAWIALDQGAVPDTVRLPARPNIPSGPICTYPNNGGIEFFGIPFGPEQRVAGGAGKSLYVGWSASYQIVQMTFSQDTTRVIERAHTPVSISDDEWAERTARFRRLQQDHPGVSCDPSDQPRPLSKPAYRWVGSDVDERLWFEVYSPEGFVFEVFNKRGRLSGQVQLPSRDARVPPAARGDRVAVVTQDSLDVQYVEVYRVTGASN